MHLMSLGFAVFFGIFAQHTVAQSYPSKSVRIIVPFPPGGPTDVVARLVTTKLNEALGQFFVIENHGGATGTIGSALAAKSPPDGYTLIMHSTSSYISKFLYRNVSYEPARDFAPIINCATFPFLLTVHRSVPVKSVAELVAFARKHPGQLAYSSPGAGSAGQLVTEMFRSAAGLDLVHVPYKGAAPAAVALSGGEVSLAFDSVSTAKLHVQQGRLRTLAVTTAKRTPLAPDMPTLQESGIPGFEAYIWFGMFGLSGTPPALLARLNAEIGKILASAEMHDRLLAIGAEFTPNTPEQFASFIAEDVPKWHKVIIDTGVRVD